MAAWRIRERAHQDIREIAAHTDQAWGARKRRAYLRQLQNRIEELAENPKLGIARDDVRQGYRSAHVGRHVVFYRIVGDGIEIVRVLHDRMDLERHLQLEIDTPTR
jgi:toxin ParE1/3/4